MDAGRFLDLYIGESQEHLLLLQRCLLGLEGGAADAVEEAFRAAHTLKGISAAMGFELVAAQAHALEDRLADVRSGALAADGQLVDELLAAADRLDSAVKAAVAAGVPTPALSNVAAAAPQRLDISGADVPAGTVRVAAVRLRSDAALPAVRAMLVMRALQDHPDILGSDPVTFDDDFDGSFRVLLGAAADPAAVRAAIESAGEIDAVEIVAARRQSPGDAPSAQPKAAAAAASLPIRIDARRLDEVADAAAELSVLFGRLQPQQTDDAATELVDRMGVVLSGLQHAMLELRMAPVSVAFERLPRVVRDAARTVGRDVALEIIGGDVALDRSIIDAIGEALVHLLRNAVDHGIEDASQRAQSGKAPRGTIRLHAERERSSVCITICDDGRGVDAARVLERAAAAGLPLPAGAPTDDDLFRLLSHPGLSTAGAVSSVSGRGVGLDVVVSRVRALGGAIDMQTTTGKGTTFTLRLPVTLALTHALHVRVGGEDYVVPLTHIAEVVELNGSAGADSIEVRGEMVRIVRLGRVLEVQECGEGAMAIVAGMGERRAALAVDELVGREQILVKSFAGVEGMLPYFSGATLLGDGRPALVLDPLSVI
jgi:two-component system, chemotaxis family, sensor kinase CheA